MKNFIIILALLFIGYLVKSYLVAQPTATEKTCFDCIYTYHGKNDEAKYLGSKKCTNICLTVLEKCPNTGVEMKNCELVRTTTAYAMVHIGVAKRLGKYDNQSKKLMEKTLKTIEPFNYCNSTFKNTLREKM